MFAVTLAYSAQANIDCSQGSYVPKIDDMVVVYDWADNYYFSKAGHTTQGELFFNDLIDPSCEKIDVLNDVVRCISNQSQIIPAGTIVGKKARYEYMEAFRVSWYPNVKVKSSYYTSFGCIYGIAIE